jgi:multidrug efflux system membrane fusion protein
MTAPFTGVAGLRLVDVGNIVQAGQSQGLVTIAQVQPIAVLFTLAGEDLVEVQRAAAVAKSNLSVVALSNDGDSQLGIGKLTAVDNAVDAASGTITLRSVFENADRLLWPGEFLRAKLTLRTVHDGLTVPDPAVQLGPSGIYVWVVTQDVAHMQPVTVVQLYGGRDLVMKGLTAGQTVVVDGQYGLTDGVKVVSEPAGLLAPLRDAETFVLGIRP